MQAPAQIWIVLAAIISLSAGAAPSHVIEPGVRIEKVTLAEETPAPKFIPDGPGPHPVALLAHELTGSTQLNKSREGSCGCAGAKPQVRQFLPQHNAPDCSSNFIEPFDPCRFFVHGVLGLAQTTRAGIQGSRVYQVNISVDTKVENAYVAGLLGTKRIVLYDTLVQNLNRDELFFVVGHEIGHYVLWHKAKRIALETILMLVSLYVAYLLAGPVIDRFKSIWGFAAPSDFAALPLGLLAFWLFCFVDRPIAMAFSRHREHEADRFGLELTHENHAAATAFVGVMQAGLEVPRPGAVFMIWFGSHPCIADRIEFCNTYHPWQTGQPSKYEKYFLPAGANGGPPLSSAQNSGH